ncbi:MAG: hypothetical protein LQ340_000523 [Diploschistes diacapsis]|nr:MAG: hypothetical protein LQ340_000523 [Diploschistes diacapsis]
MERFDKFAADQRAAPQTNGHAEAEPIPEPVPSIEPPVTKKESTPTPESKVGTKRKSESEDEDGNADNYSEPLSDVPNTPPPKKKRKPEVEDDAAFAARLQAEENSRARSTRGAGQRKPPVAKKKKTPKKKSSHKVKIGNDSDLDGSGSGAEKKVNRSGGFHVSHPEPRPSFPRGPKAKPSLQKPLTLSAPLSALLDGETQVPPNSSTSISPPLTTPQLSRPQTVKRIWAYVKERDLQDPKDKRQIRCDDALRAVFKQEKVHMFTMNRILATQMYDPDA